MKVIVKQNVVDIKSVPTYHISLSKPYYNKFYDNKGELLYSIPDRWLEDVYISDLVKRLKSTILEYNWDTKWLIEKLTVGGRPIHESLEELEIIKELEFDITPLSIGDSISIDGNNYTIDKIGYNSDNGAYEIIVKEIEHIEIDHSFDLDKETELLRAEVNKVLDEIRIEREKAMVSETIGETVGEKEKKTIVDKIKEFIDGIRHSRRNRR